MIRTTQMRIKRYLYLSVTAAFVCALIVGSNMGTRALSLELILQSFSSSPSSKPWGRG